ncbi:unnamed protein product [Gadus morhua 'NCC']
MAQAQAGSGGSSAIPMRTSHTSSSLFPAMAICARDQLACSRHLSERHERAVHRGYTALGAGTPVNAYRRGLKEGVPISARPPAVPWAFISAISLKLV